MFLLIGIILFILLVVAHEYGHFLVAKRNGIEVEEFGIGFPPKLAGKKMGKGIFECYYTINLLPLGGFVKLKGESDQDKRKNSFGAASFKAKVKVMLAGIFTNYLVGALLFIGLAYGSLPYVFEDQTKVGATITTVESGIYISKVVDGFPAADAGIEQSDKILKFNGQELGQDDDLLASLLEENKNQEVSIEYLDFSNQDELTSVDVTLTSGEGEDGRTFGANFAGGAVQQLESEWWSAPINGFMFANRIFVETFKFIGSAVGSLFAGDPGEASEGLAGPVGIVRELGNISNISQLVAITANISIALAVANLLPIPGLDGGKLYTMLIFKALGKRLTEKWEQAIYGTGVMLLLILIILITYSDIFLN